MWRNPKRQNRTSISFLLGTVIFKRVAWYSIALRWTFPSTCVGISVEKDAFTASSKCRMKKTDRENKLLKTTTDYAQGQSLPALGW